MKSLPMASPFANSAMPSEAMPEGFLGRGTLGERPRAPPVMTVHQLNSQAQFVVRLLVNACLSCPFFSPLNS